MATPLPKVYIPDRLFHWPTPEAHSVFSPSLSKEDHPAADKLFDDDEFPFRPPKQWSPQGMEDVVRKRMRATPLVKTPTSTKEGRGSTKPSKRILRVVEHKNETLEDVRNSPAILGNLKAYALGKQTVSLSDIPRDSSGNLKWDPLSIDTWDWVSQSAPGHRAGIPSADQRSRVIQHLAQLYSAHCFRKPSPVSCEAAVVAEFHAQVASFVAVWLQLRYDHNARDNDAKHLWVCNNQLVSGQEQWDDFLSSIAYPFWGFPVQEDHEYGVLTQSTLPEKTRSNNADLLLYASPDEHPAFAEVKAWWVVPMKFIEAFLVKTSDRNGKPRWSAPAKGDFASVNWLKQFWAEHFSYACRFSLFTNGQGVLFGIRTGNHELTFSNWVHWSDPELYTIFLGFCMVALDTCFGGPRWHFPGSDQATRDEEWTVWYAGFQSRADRLVEAICPEKSRSVARDITHGMLGVPEPPSTGEDPLKSWA
ncbi:hypothetical protein K488DRAFT_87280 [Vararia minispora EC-137]|uniref:Uncharacterized protein n=1 Tax=Vararia minispora EC-137 TaxID=1314806 RepID=A0ACB8QH47_9AGAM|nr:hypothetical protein K488DRAFT_87280 [Vararia minispora EC-137]